MNRSMRQLRLKMTIQINPGKDHFKLIKTGTNKKDNLAGDSSIDQLKGKKSADQLRGKQGADYLYGNKGKDSLFGGYGADVLQGGPGADQLHGKGGKDLLYGDNGKDQATGDAGQDIFILSRGKDVITDFTLGQDSIGLGYAVDLKAVQKGPHLRIKGSDKINTLLHNINKDDFLENITNNPSMAPIVEIKLI